jgi:hypothetical protein
MRILPSNEDDLGFLAAIDQVVAGVLRDSRPSSVIVIQIDNWFGPKWLGFSGKVLGALGVWSTSLTVPPFVPSRVVSQRRFAFPTYEEVNPGKPIHREVPSTTALGRKVSDVAPGSALIWYSGSSKKNHRGSLLIYAPEGNAYNSWYAQWEDFGGWHLAQTKGIKVAEVLKLMSSTELDRSYSLNEIDQS